MALRGPGQRSECWPDDLVPRRRRERVTALSSRRLPKKLPPTFSRYLDLQNLRKMELTRPYRLPSARTKHVRQKSKQQYPPKGMYHWGTDEKKRVRGCPSCPYNIKVGRCEVGLRKFPKITAVRRWYSSFGWNFRHNTTEWTFKNVVLAFQNVLTFENSLWWRLLVNDQQIQQIQKMSLELPR